MVARSFEALGAEAHFMNFMRLLAGALGAGAWIFGLFAIFTFDEDRHILVGLSGLGTGVYFLNYAITGRQFLFHRKRPGGDRE